MGTSSRNRSPIRLQTFKAGSHRNLTKCSGSACRPPVPYENTSASYGWTKQWVFTVHHHYRMIKMGQSWWWEYHRHVTHEILLCGWWKKTETKKQTGRNSNRGSASSNKGETSRADCAGGGAHFLHSWSRVKFHSNSQLWRNGNNPAHPRHWSSTWLQAGNTIVIIK